MVGTDHNFKNCSLHDRYYFQQFVTRNSVPLSIFIQIPLCFGYLDDQGSGVLGPKNRMPDKANFDK